MRGILVLALCSLPALLFGAGRPALERETAAYLSDLVRINTVSPPGNEREACEYLGGVLRGAGIPYDILESTPGRANLIARLNGDGSGRPVLLLAHLDTVGVERGLWSFPPFAGDRIGGYIRGRGAIDDKAMVAAFLTAMLELKRTGASLKRDVIFAAVADEESGGKYGVQWLLEHHPGKIDAEFAVNEGGTTFIGDGKVRLLAVQTLEKSYYDIRLTARGDGGHASVPHVHNAIHLLSRTLTRIAAWERPSRLNSVTRAYFAGVSRLESAAVREALADMLSGEDVRVGRSSKVLRDHPYYYAMAHDTVVPTLIAGGFRANVVASRAWVNLNVRLLPDSDPRDFLRELAGVVDNPAVEISVVAKPAGPGPGPMPLDNEFYAAFRKVAERLFPSAIVVPSMSVGSTDSEFLRRRGIRVYGLEFPLTLADEARIHGHDEKITAAGLGDGVRFILELLREVAA